MIYTDGLHLVTDGDINELHEFAQSIGLKKTWFQEKLKKPHYDIWGVMVRNAINKGAKEVSSKEIIRILNNKQP